MKGLSLLGAFLVCVAFFSLANLWHVSHFIPQEVSSLGEFFRVSTDAEETLIHSSRHQARAQESAPPVIAHVISLITCHKKTRVKGFLDALVILRHSIHQQSAAAGNGGKYGYQMYAIVYDDGDCTEHVPLLERLGYTPLVKPVPVNVSAITSNDWYRNHVHQENCCGSFEFVKLYAYTLVQHPVVVHWDLDVLVLRNMDDLYDSMLFPAHHVTGAAARARLNRERPNVELPDTIDAFFTRDVTSAAPWERIQAVQGGFVVARPSMKHFRTYQKFIMEANYTRGRGPHSGWGGMGYGGFQGAMAYQGVLAYFYDQLHPYAVELDVCRWNQVVADVIWRGPEKFEEHHGQCRKFPADGIDFTDNTPENGYCDDCRITPVDETYTVHYTACNKPWDCQLPHPRIPNKRRKAHAYRLREKTNVTTCGLLFEKYFDVRLEVEELIQRSLAKNTDGSPTGTFHPEYFRGYCKGPGRYTSMEIPDNFDFKEIYGF